MSTPVQPPASPAAAGSTPTGSGSAPQGNIGTVVQLPPNQLPPEAGQVLSGTVLARAANGSFLLQTEAGQLLLQTPALLPPGAGLALQVLQGGTRPQVLILPGSSAAGGAPTAVAPGSIADVTSLTQGALVAATVTRANAAPNTPAAGGTVPRTGGTDGSTQSTATPGTSPLAAAPQSAAAPVAQSFVPTALPQGAALTLRVLSIVPPGASSGMAAGTVAAVIGRQGIPGVVTGANAAGQPIVRTPVGELTLTSGNTPPPGSMLRLEMVGAPRLPAGEAAQPLALSQQWEALHALLAAAKHTDPAVAQLLQQAVPQPGPSLTTGILFFLSALLTGDLRRWLGEDAARALERAGPLAGKLDDDFRRMQQLAREPSGQDWRLLLVPLLANGRPEYLRCFLRDRRSADSQDDEAESGSRFIIEVELSQLGPFQFDGLARRKTIDLVIRTQQVLSQDMRRDIAAIHADTMSALGFAGELAFQAASPFVNPLEEISGESVGLSV